MGKVTVMYKEANGCQIYADIYKCQSERSTAAILYFHGGGFIFGTREWLTKEQILLFHQSGFHVISFDYRLAPEVKLHEIIEDLRDAVVWFKHRASQLLGCDTIRFAVMGSSAGAYASLMIGTMRELAPAAIVSFYGYGSITEDWIAQPSTYYSSLPTIDRQKAIAALSERPISESGWRRYEYYQYCRQKGSWIEEVTGEKFDKNKPWQDKFNPIELVHPDYPPTLLLHGTQDTDVPYEQSQLMHNQLLKSGISSQLVTIEGAGHGFDVDFSTAHVQSAYQEVIRFLNRYLIS
ncbi:alpha/beta hydrolase [Paenibacillus xylanexedens]|uniref:alpha/beta hydrolase n=1 Tax=Paenibacillus xylanexedens TaxID=528191 RepID=UPI0021B587B7|nr:alpha/beta hydrolase [Paenibacillus xylanexedens]